MKKDFAIKLSNVSKKYQLITDKPTLVEKISLLSEKKEFWALKMIDLEIKKGERVGIAGPNGAGKTTLLKIIAGITTPTNGSVAVNGKVVSIIDLTAGFHPDMSGSENIMLNGMLLGMSKSEIISKKTSIIDFANIKNFIHSPTHTYSSGMKLRLGFAIAINADPDIIIMDEGFMVGDRDFQNKSLKAFERLNRNKGVTLVITSQWREYLKKNCNRIIEMNQGKITKSSNIKKSKSPSNSFF